MIGDKLRKLRERKGYTQQQLADCIGKDRSMITKIECDISSPSVETAKALGQILTVDWTVFFQEQSEYTAQHDSEPCNAGPAYHGSRGDHLETRTYHGQSDSGISDR